MRHILLATGLLLGAAACTDTLDPLPLTVSLESSAATAIRGDSVTFTVSAQGGSLIGVEMDYGDGNIDAYATSGARTARVTFRHAFDVTGTFTVSAAATDAVGGRKDASLQIQVN